jgi:two-component system, cell cycle sensor histidine kinase and response regulator CckA
MLNILLAEDDEAFRCLMSRVLTGQGYNVIEAGDGMQALNVAKAHKGPLHLLCADAGVTRMDAPALADRLRPEHPEMKVLMLVPAKHIAVVATRRITDVHPEYGVLQRPFTLDQLTLKVQEMLAVPKGQAALPA